MNNHTQRIRLLMSPGLGRKAAGPQSPSVDRTSRKVALDALRGRVIRDDAAVVKHAPTPFLKLVFSSVEVLVEVVGRSCLSQ